MGPKRFNFNANPNYDIALLTETESLNPFAQKTQKATWDLIATNLLGSQLQMPVTGRTCKERFHLLMADFRKDEALSLRAPGIEEDELNEIKTLLTKIKEPMDSLTPKVKRLYKNVKREQAEVTRAEALIELEDSDEDHNPDTVDTATLDGDVVVADPDSENDNEQKETEPEKDTEPPKPPKRLKKGNLVAFLENKQKNEIDFKREELVVRKLEAENRRIELEIKNKRQESESTDRSKITDLLVKLLDK